MYLRHFHWLGSFPRFFCTPCWGESSCDLNWCFIVTQAPSVASRYFQTVWTETFFIMESKTEAFFLFFNSPCCHFMSWGLWISIWRSKSFLWGRRNGSGDCSSVWMCKVIFGCLCSYNSFSWVFCIVPIINNFFQHWAPWAQSANNKVESSILFPVVMIAGNSWNKSRNFALTWSALNALADCLFLCLKEIG